VVKGARADICERIGRVDSEARRVKPKDEGPTETKEGRCVVLVRQWGSKNDSRCKSSLSCNPG